MGSSTVTALKRKSKGSTRTTTSKRSRLNTTMFLESDLDGRHVILTSDVSGENSSIISVPDCLLKEMMETIKIMKTAKIQFGLMVEFVNDHNEFKVWNLSNRARPMSDTFIDTGILELKGKIEIYSELSSGWHIHRVMEVHMTLTKTEDIINLSGNLFGKYIY